MLLYNYPAKKAIDLQHLTTSGIAYSKLCNEYVKITLLNRRFVLEYTSKHRKTFDRNMEKYPSGRRGAPAKGVVRG